MTVNKLYNYMA